MPYLNFADYKPPSNGSIFVPVDPVKEPAEEYVQEVYYKLLPSRFTWNPPEALRVGESKVITALISSDLTKDITKEIENGKPPAKIQVSTFLKVQLYGSDFNIELQAPEKQALPVGGTAKWRWKVKPLNEGEQFLELNVFARIKIGNAPEEDMYLVSYSEKILVKVNPLLFWQENWKWLVENSDKVGLTLTGIAAICIAQRKQIRRWLRMREKKTLKLEITKDNQDAKKE